MRRDFSDFRKALLELPDALLERGAVAAQEIAVKDVGIDGTRYAGDFAGAAVLPKVEAPGKGVLEIPLGDPDEVFRKHLRRGLFEGLEVALAPVKARLKPRGGDLFAEGLDYLELGFKGKGALFLLLEVEKEGEGGLFAADGFEEELRLLRRFCGGEGVGVVVKAEGNSVFGAAP